MRLTMMLLLSVCFCFGYAPLLLYAGDSVSLPLAVNGTTNYQIVVSDAPTPVEQSAARELQTHLQKITGAGWNIIAESKADDDLSHIFIGDSKRARTSFPDVNFETVPYDGIVIQTNGRDLLLAGHPVRGTLYAVNTFLEDNVGCRWWSSTESSIPSKPTLTVELKNIAYAPKLIYREAYYKDAFDSMFAVRCKCNGSGEPIPAEYGGHHRFVYFVHSFYPLIPPEKYFDAHPEWFSEIDGKRTHDQAQLCLTNDEMRRELTKNALEALRKNPDAKFISISQNDWYKPCQCEKCRAIAKAEGSESGPLITFVNQVAEEIEKEFPDVWVETLAYQYTRKPPLHVKPRHNVIVRLCTIECSFIQPLGDGEQNKPLRDDIQGWSKIAPQLFIWDYVTSFSSYILPHPNYAILAPNIRFFVDHGTIGLFEQGDSYTTVGDFIRMRNWVISHLMWDPSRDEKQLIDEFLNGYYGEKAVPILKEYFQTLVQRAEKSNVYLGCFRDNTNDWLDLDTLNRATLLMNQAIDAAKDSCGADSPEVARLQREKLPIDHVWLKEYYRMKRQADAANKPFLGPADPLEACQAFIALADKYKNTAYREYNTPDTWREFKTNLLSRFGKPAPTPDICKNLPPGSWADYQEFEFQLSTYNDWANTVDDPAASNGRAAGMPGDHFEWATSMHLSEEIHQMKPAGGKTPESPLFQVFAAIRCDATAHDGAAMTIGVYDEKAKKGLAQKTVDVSEINGPDYKLIDLGEVPLNTHSYIWVAPPKRPGEVQAVFVDRFIVIKK